ncbi:MAG: hypothetical protein J5794_05745 [Lachnospiraceae bacterium]|nr:hypothetical protein [Lachnospiraceae bacterium]
METKETANKPELYNSYLSGTHRFGKIMTTVVLLLLLAAPFVIGLFLNAVPNIPKALKAFVGVGIVYLASGIVEYLVYVPMLGAGGSYLAFITGNLINMKIPCAINARDIVGVKSGTPENEIISTLSIATSSLVTILVLAFGILLMIPLQPVLQSPALQPAFDNVVPALFGAMACKYYRSNKTVALIVLAFMTLLFTLVPSLIGSTSMMVIPSGALAIVLAYLSFRKKKKAEEEAAGEGLEETESTGNAGGEA